MRHRIILEFFAVDALEVMLAIAHIYIIEPAGQLIIMLYRSAVGIVCVAKLTDVRRCTVAVMFADIEDLFTVRTNQRVVSDIHTAIHLIDVIRFSCTFFAADGAYAGIGAEVLALVVIVSGATGDTHAAAFILIVLMRQFIAHDFIAVKAEDAVSVAAKINPVILAFLGRVIVERQGDIRISIQAAASANAELIAILEVRYRRIDFAASFALCGMLVSFNFNELPFTIVQHIITFLATGHANTGIGAKAEAKMALIAAEGAVHFKFFIDMRLL